MRHVVAAALALALCGCATVSPYQRGYLARPEMLLEASIGMAKALEKTYSSKEAASGGEKVGGGGCGCN